MNVKYHSWAKHVFLCSYLQACEKIYKYRPRTIRFYYSDLFAGDGICKCKLPTGDVEEWDGSAKSALYYCSNMGDSFCGAFFNDYERVDDLYKNIRHLVKERNKIHFFSKRADEVVDEILSMIPSNSQSFFFLDPEAHSDLSWKTIEKIANHTSRGEYKGEKFTRRPEIMVNLMTMGMQRNYKKPSNHDVITKALGTYEWKNEVEKCLKEGEPVYLAFERVFGKQLRRLYRDPLIKDEKKQPFPYSFQVKTAKNQVIYYMFFISSHPLANQMFKKLLPYMERYKKRRLAEFVIWKARASGIKPLTDFGLQNAITLYSPIIHV